MWFLATRDCAAFFKQPLNEQLCKVGIIGAIEAWISWILCDPEIFWDGFFGPFVSENEHDSWKVWTLNSFFLRKVAGIKQFGLFLQL